MRNTGMREGSIKKHLSIHKKRLTAAAAAVLAVIVLLASIPVMQAQAVFDESTAVRFRTYKQSNTIENSIIFIGTHLIHIQAMTDELYEKAVQSQSDSDQQEVYYKSELSDGTWYNITDATGLSDITVEGTPVNESELDDLFVAYYTGADGITKNAKTGETVCIFDDPNPYDLLKLEELEIIRQVRSQAYSEEEEGVHKYLYRSLNSFFANDVTNETTRECDRALKNLQRLYEAYCTAGMDEDAQVISSLMESVDATRRAEVYAKVSQDGEPQKVTVNLWFTNTTYTIPNYSLLTDLSNTVSGEYYDSGQYDDEDFRLDSELLDAVVTSIGDCNSSYTSYASKALAPGGTTIRSYIYDQMRALVDLCEDSGSISLDSNIIGLVNNIKYAQNIENGVVGDADAEAKLLDDEFIPTEADAYTKALQTGVSAEYQAAVNANKSDAAKKSILDNDALALDVARTALETMITAKKLRLSSSDAVNYIYERISWTYEQEKNIPKDDFAVYAKQSAADHIAWLTDMAKGIADEDASQMSELDRLKTLLSDYLEKQQDAYDDGNLELAAQYKTLADDTSAKIAAEEARLNDILNSDTASEAEKAAAEVALGQTGLLSNINKLKNDALSAINTGDTDKLQSAVEMLATLGGEKALSEIKNALDSSNLSSTDKEKWSGKLDEAIASSKESSLYDQANATQVADGSGAGNAAGQGANTAGQGANTAGQGANTAGQGANMAGQGADGLLGNIAKLKNVALNAVNQGETGGLQSAIDLLAILGAENALNEIKNAVSASNLSSADKEKWTGKLNSAITSSRNSSIHDQANAAQASGGSAAENAAALAALGGSGLKDNITKLKNVAKSAVTQGETGSLQSAIDLLAMLGGETALNEIKSAVNSSSLSSADKDKWSEKLDEAIASSKNSSFYDQANAAQSANGNGSGAGSGSGSNTGSGAGSGTGTGSGTGSGSGTGTGSGTGSGGSTGTGSGSGSGTGSGSDSGTGTGSGAGSSASSPVTMSERTLTNAIEQVLGESFNELDDDGKSAAIAAMDRLYDEYKNVNAKKLAASYISKSVSERSPYVYTQLTGHSEAEYIPLSLIGTKPISSYRYVYSDSRQEATMTYGARSLRFRVGSDVVTLADGTQQKIQNYKVEFQNTPYIDENTAKTFFECEAEYITGTRYAICVTKKIKEQADELYQELTGQ